MNHFQLARLVALNVVWLGMVVYALIATFGWTVFMLVTLWSAVELALFYVPAWRELKAALGGLRETNHG